MFERYPKLIIMSISISNEISEETLERALQYITTFKSKQAFINKIPSVKKTPKKDIIANFQRNYQDDRLVLVLGAGVSMGFGLPNWDALLQKLMITTIEKEQSVSTVLSKLFTNIFQPSPLIAGRFLQKYYEDKQMLFEEAVQKILYSSLDMNKQSELMDEIVNFCVAPGKRHSLDSIITYNFDDILEQRIDSIGIDVPFKSIFGTEMNAHGQLPIYHVHGFLPHKGALSVDNQITFGESIYHKQYIDIYSWNNIVQINKFRDCNCIFIGTSLTDPNIRRLLDIARRQKGKSPNSHFIFKMRHKEADVKQRLNSLLNENKQLLDEKSLANLEFDKTVKFLIEIVEKFEERDTESFGVSTLWVDAWSEVPSILNQIRTLKTS
ncbi:SIR2 family protein [Mucilaginibacter sp. BJC16-A38]|uniref:SIR2 family protein n=1 Tax=Mucilaginibacter phenanthrenivorans TaxID=1234842 RepID=UPI0021589367|nr:SIR2 family protein [Mucilaginibacter phenanthrenivorans]MCR8559232.1 SIR2 family protein [Mucilaginibacter phenanthrenivorans]